MSGILSLVEGLLPIAAAKMPLLASAMVDAEAFALRTSSDSCCRSKMQAVHQVHLSPSSSCVTLVDALQKAKDLDDARHISAYLHAFNMVVEKKVLLPKRKVKHNAYPPPPPYMPCSGSNDDTETLQQLQKSSSSATSNRKRM
jgi:hypothetical protein